MIPLTARKVLIKKWEKSTHCESIDTDFIEDVVYPAMEEYHDDSLSEITMERLMTYYSNSKGHDFNTPVIDILRDIKNQ